MSLSNCKECTATDCVNAGTETKVPCFSCTASKPVEELKQFIPTHVSLNDDGMFHLGGYIEPAQKKPDLVPTMNLRLLRYKMFDDESTESAESQIMCEVLQQQFLDRNVINQNGTAGGEQWIDVPIVTE